MWSGSSRLIIVYLVQLLPVSLHDEQYSSVRNLSSPNSFGQWNLPGIVTLSQCRQQDSNLQPTVYKAAALPIALRRLIMLCPGHEDSAWAKRQTIRRAQPLHARVPPWSSPAFSHYAQGGGTRDQGPRFLRLPFRQILYDVSCGGWICTTGLLVMSQLIFY